MQLAEGYQLSNIIEGCVEIEQIATPQRHSNSIRLREISPCRHRKGVMLHVEIGTGGGLTGIDALESV